MRLLFHCHGQKAQAAPSKISFHIGVLFAGVIRMSAAVGLLHHARAFLPGATVPLEGWLFQNQHAMSPDIASTGHTPSFFGLFFLREDLCSDKLAFCLICLTSNILSFLATVPLGGDVLKK